jgi:hypothetical protein
MELNLTELDNINTMNPYDNFDYNSYNQDNYWDKQQSQETQSKKKKVSFNDILSNMNLVVNKEGVLQFMTPIKNENPMKPQQNQYQQNQYQQNQYQQNQYQQNQYQQNQNQQNKYQQNQNQQNKYQQNQNQQNQNQQNQKKNEPLDPNVKHSYIYNKYFKDYVNTNVEKQGPRVPKTIEEYQKMLLEDKIKAIQHKKMVEQVKSKKMLFTTTPDMSLNPKNIQASKNNLRMMNFK